MTSVGTQTVGYIEEPKMTTLDWTGIDCGRVHVGTEMDLHARTAAGLRPSWLAPGRAGVGTGQSSGRRDNETD